MNLDEQMKMDDQVHSIRQKVVDGARTAGIERPLRGEMARRDMTNVDPMGGMKAYTGPAEMQGKALPSYRSNMRGAGGSTERRGIDVHD